MVDSGLEHHISSGGKRGRC